MLFFLWFFIQQPTPVSSQDLPTVDYEELVSVVSFHAKINSGKRVVMKLKARDFILKENDLDISITGVEPVYLPKTMELLIDLSSSNTIGLDRSKKMCRSIIEDAQAKDRIKISAFSKIYLQWTPFTSDRTMLLNSLDKLQERGSTALYDTMFKAINTLSAEKGPKALVVFSDGRDLLSTISQKKLENRISSLGIPVFLIYTGKPPTKKADLLVRQYKFLQNLIRISHGAWFTSEDGYSKAIQKQFLKISFRYKISYQPPQPEITTLWRRRVLSIRNHPEYQCLYPVGYRMKTP
jgi:hypothetical protein